MFCTQCGKPLANDARFCSDCGSATDHGSQQAMYAPGGGGSVEWETAEYTKNSSGHISVRYSDGTIDSLGNQSPVLVMQALLSDGWEVIGSHSDGSGNETRILKRESPYRRHGEPTLAAYQRATSGVLTLTWERRLSRLGLWGWTTGRTTDYDFKFKDGVYHLQVFSLDRPILTSYIYWQWDKVDYGGISACFDIVSIGEGGQYGLAWGYTKVENYYIFAIRSDGSVCIAKRSAGSWNMLRPWGQAIDMQKGGARNTLLAVKMVDTWRFSINEAPVAEVHISEEKLGQGVGFYLANPVYVTTSSLNLLHDGKIPQIGS